MLIMYVFNFGLKLCLFMYDSIKSKSRLLQYRVKLSVISRVLEKIHQIYSLLAPLVRDQKCSRSKNASSVLKSIFDTFF